MSIKQLPQDVAAQIRSSVVISSLNHVVCGLVGNSLDADASKINVSVDYQRGGCSVEDDGHGIPPSDFHRTGGLGKLYYTSKYPPRPDRHGRHGTFLASVAALSLLSIASHHSDYNSHNSVSFHNSNVIARNVPALPEQRVLTFPHGTRVTVRDLFGSMPVRVKQRAIEVERSGSSKTLEQLLLALVALAISWPGEISISLRDANSQQTLRLRTAGLGKQRLSPHATDASTILARTPRLLAQASLYDSAGIESWVPIGASAPGISINGCVCLQPVATKRLQFLAIGVEPFLNESRSNFLYEEVNRVFAKSAFGVANAEGELGGPSTDERASVPKAKDLKSRKGVDRWPIFYLQIFLHGQPLAKLSDFEDSFDRGAQGLTMIADLLRTMSYEFLKKHHFRPKPIHALHAPDASDSESAASAKSQLSAARRHSDSDSGERRPRNSRSPFPSDIPVRGSRYRRSSRQQALYHPANRTVSPFDLWSKVKAGRSLARMQKSVEEAASEPSDATRREMSEGGPDALDRAPHSPSPATASSALDKSGKLLRRPFDDIEAVRRKESSLPSPSPPDSDIGPQQDSNLRDETVIWVDPMTKVRSTINKRTGFLVNTHAGTNKRISLPSTSRPDKEPAPQSSPWIEDILSSWENPAFHPTEQPIPRIADVSETLLPQAGNGNSCSAIKSFGTTEEPSAMMLLNRISGNALRQAEIVGQVDAKFILVKVPLDPPVTTPSAPPRPEYDLGSLLVLIDQHAADERCRVESLMKSYFLPDESESGSWQARSEVLEKPLMFELPPREGQLLCRYQAHFEHWGIMLRTIFPWDAGSGKASKANVKVEVQSLPPSILERCRLEPRLLIDLLRKDVWKLHDEPGIVLSHKGKKLEGPGDSDWVRKFHGCPQGILDLINSRACRSAIMFNDVLTSEQCKSLVKGLTDCAFPFQCAHGRPSMVPLVDLGSSRALGYTESNDRGNLLGEIRRWQEKTQEN